MKRPNDDLFQNTTMTFGEHLEELRSCLFKALMGLLVGFGIGLYFADEVVRAIQLPLEAALMDFYKQKSVSEVESRFGARYASEILSVINSEGLIPDRIFIEPARISAIASDELAAPAPLSPGTAYSLRSDHLNQPVAMAQQLLESDDAAVVRVREQLSPAGRAAAEAVAGSNGPTDEQIDQFAAELDLLLASPSLFEHSAFSSVSLPAEVAQIQTQLEAEPDQRLQRRMNWLVLSAVFPNNLAPPKLELSEIIIWRHARDDERIQAQSLGVEEPFMIWIKAALITGAVIASPWIFYQIWSFVAAGLYPHEKKYIHMYLPFSVFLFLAGAALAYFFVFEPVLGFLFSFNQDLNINPDPKIGQWLNFFLMLPIGFGISFQLPLVMLFLQRIGVMSVETYLEKWRISILVIFVISAVLTPADPYSMLLMAVPLTLLYFGGIGLCRWLPGGRNPYEEELA